MAEQKLMKCFICMEDKDSLDFVPELTGAKARCTDCINKKRCPACETALDLSLYHMNASGPNPRCKPCTSAKNKADYQARKDKVKVKHAEVRAERKAGIRPPADVGALERRRAVDPAERKADRRAKVNAAAAARQVNSLRANAEKRVDSRWRKALLAWGPSLEEMVGCPVDQFTRWIEYLWTPGMTWENYGAVWSYDHVKPRSGFDLMDKAEVDKCFHWTNTRPFLSTQNSSKRNKNDEIAINTQSNKVIFFLYGKEIDELLDELF